MDDFMAAFNKVGYRELEDINKMGPTNGAMRTMSYIDPEGRRQDTAHMYLHPRLRDDKHPNLHVLVESQVERVLIENQKAVGVVYRPNPQYQPGGSSRTVKAKRMVIMNCGALGTPPVLERSGVGNPKILERAGVPLKADVPGIGHDYEDHQGIMYPYKSILTPEETLDNFNALRVDHDVLIKNKDALLSWNSVDIQAKLRPTESEVAGLGEEFQEMWNRDFKNIPDKPMMILSPCGW